MENLCKKMKDIADTANSKEAYLRNIISKIEENAMNGTYGYWVDFSDIKDHGNPNYSASIKSRLEVMDFLTEEIKNLGFKVSTETYKIAGNQRVDQVYNLLISWSDSK